MNQIKQLDESISVADQILPQDIPTIAAMGYKSLICNRPDGEEPGQPEWADVAAAAGAAGMECRHIPIGGSITPDDQAQTFAEAIKEMPQPVLAFCRTGNRSLQVSIAARKKS